MVRHTVNGVLYTSWSFSPDEDLIGQALAVHRVIRDMGAPVLWLSQIDDTARLNADAVKPEPNIIAVGPNGSDIEFGRAIHDFAERHGVLRVYRFMTVEDGGTCA